jgi:hypothetical protein
MRHQSQHILYARAEVRRLTRIRPMPDGLTSLREASFQACVGAVTPHRYAVFAT